MYIEIVSDIQNNFFTQHVLPIFCKKKSLCQRFTCKRQLLRPFHSKYLTKLVIFLNKEASSDALQPGKSFKSLHSWYILGRSQNLWTLTSFEGCRRGRFQPSRLYRGGFASSSPSFKPIPLTEDVHSLESV